MKPKNLKRCICCKEYFSSMEVAEWEMDHEKFSTRPLICPWCYNNEETTNPEPKKEN